MRVVIHEQDPCATVCELQEKLSVSPSFTPPIRVSQLVTIGFHTDVVFADSRKEFSQKYELLQYSYLFII